MVAKIKLGYAACELAPEPIVNLPLAKIKGNMELLKNHVEFPIHVWIILVQKACWDHIEAERFDKFVQAFRPWRLLGDPTDSASDKRTSGGPPHPHVLIVV